MYNSINTQNYSYMFLSFSVIFKEVVTIEESVDFLTDLQL